MLDDGATAGAASAPWTEGGSKAEYDGDSDVASRAVSGFGELMERRRKDNRSLVSEKEGLPERSVKAWC